MIDGTLYMQLPSGRLLGYPQSRLEYDSRRRKQVVFKDNASGQWRDEWPMAASYRKRRQRDMPRPVDRRDVADRCRRNPNRHAHS